MSSKRKYKKVAVTVFLCDDCGAEHKSRGVLIECPFCDREVCPKCRAFSEYHDNWVCKRCKTLGAKYEEAIERIRQVAEEKCEAQTDLWREAALAAREEIKQVP